MIFVKYSIFKVKNPHASTDGTLKDFCDGEDSKNHPLFGENHSGLVLLVISMNLKSQMHWDPKRKSTN